MLKEALVDYDAATGRMRTTPRQVFLELTPRCNLTCVHCPKDYGRVREGEDADMPLATLERLRPWLRTAHAVNLNIVGEPMIARHFMRALQLCADGPATVGFNTNGTALTEPMCEVLVRGRVAQVVVSFDGVESNHAIRGVDYRSVRDRLLTLAAVRQRLGSNTPAIGIAFTLMRRNLHELPRLLADLMPRTRIDYVHVQPLVIFYETLRDQNVYYRSEVNDAVERARAIVDRHGGSLVLFRSTLAADERFLDDDEELQLGQHSHGFGCIDPFYEIKVKADGSVQPCSNRTWPELNVARMELDQIWNHPRYGTLRRSLQERRYDNRCRCCPFRFGSADHQESQLRSGVHHSKAERFRAGAVGHLPTEIPPRRSYPFLPAPDAAPQSRGLFE